MSSYVMGIDLGSTTAKCVVLDGEGVLVGKSIVQMGAVSRIGVAVAIDESLRSSGLRQGDIDYTVSTGYGRRLVDVADRNFTEITCHARGVAALWPAVRLVIDIGGQDSKVIAVDENGFVDRFAMNDRCASGTGRFFEVLGRALEVGLDELGALALAGTDDLQVSSMCATFAETEVISLLAQGAAAADIAASVHRAVAARTLGLVAQVGKRGPIAMSGGVAKNPAAVHYVSAAIGMPVDVSADPQISGAYGAAVIALDHQSGNRPGADLDDRSLVGGRMETDKRSCVTCDGVLNLGAGDQLLEITPLQRVGKS